MTREYEIRIDKVVDTQFDGDQTLREAAKELARIKGTRLMCGAYYTRDMYRDFRREFSPEVAYAAGDVLDIANDEL